MEEEAGADGKDANSAIVDPGVQGRSFETVPAGSTEALKREIARLTSVEQKLNEIQELVATAGRVAQTQVASIEVMHHRASEAVRQIEEATRKANSESGYAFNEKGNAEDHFTAVAQIRGTVESTFSSLTATKTQADEAVQAITAMRNASDAEAKAIAETKAASATAAASITAAHERVAAVLPAIEQGTKDANAITAAKAGADANVVAIQALQTQMADMLARATAESAVISKTEEDSKKLVALMADAQEKANEANIRLDAYEQQIAQLASTYADTHTKLEGLLPHATSVGLASAFHNQKSRFAKSQPYWIGLFALAILGLLLASLIGLPSTSDSWDSTFRHFVNRLPIVAPLVWVAIYAGHHYGMALRMEEDYAFKEAISTAFEGYKREMLEIPPSPGSDVSPLVTLCENALRALAERPGRIYDGKGDMITPLTPASSAMKDVLAEFAKWSKSKAQS